MKISIKSITPATLTLNCLGNYIIHGFETALNVNVSEGQLVELNVLEREGLVRIDREVSEDYVEPVKKGRGRPKGAKNRTTLAKEIENKKQQKKQTKLEKQEKEQAKDQIETNKVTRNKSEAEAITDEMGAKAIVAVPGGPAKVKMVNSFVGEANEVLHAEASVKAMEELEAEERDEVVDEKYVINEEDLDPSERMGGKAVISTGGHAKQIDLVNSILPESQTIKERDPFIDREDNAEIEKIKKTADSDEFIEDNNGFGNSEDEDDPFLGV